MGFIVNIEFSIEYPLDKTGVKKAPKKPGVYYIYQSEDYNRYKGSTRILKIGMSRINLHSELNNHLPRHAAKNRIIRIKNEGLQITFSYLVTETGKEAKKLEDKLLKEFEEEHWELPFLTHNAGTKEERIIPDGVAQLVRNK